MTTLTKTNAKERCRTCLRKLIKNEFNTDQCEESTTRNNFLSINTDKQLQDLLEKYVDIEGADGIKRDEEYPTNVCSDCFKQLQAFEAFRSRALASAEKLHRVFGPECGVHKIELDDNGFECKEMVKDLLNCDKEGEHYVFNMLLKDSLMETEAILLDGSQENHDTNTMGPDPFQAEIVEGKRRSKRGRQKETFSSAEVFGKAKIDNTSNVTKSLRKSKSRKCKASASEENLHVPVVVNDDAQSPQTTVTLAAATSNVAKSENEKLDQDGSDFDWQMDFPTFSDDDSTDNEVLSKKIKHSSKTLSPRAGHNESNVGPCSDTDSVLQSLSNFDKTSNDEHKDEDPGNLDGFKSEFESESASSESEYNVEIATKSSKMNAPTRKRSAASGRKKGLTNSHKCDQCNRRFGHKITLDAHVRKIHQGEKRAYKCELCDKSYSFMGGLTTHMRETHERQEQVYQCKVPGCDKNYTSYITLQRHVRVKHLMTEVPTRYVCEQCGATFKQTSNLRYHMRTRHPTEEDLKHKEIIKERLECEICKKSFNNLYTLKYHTLRIHADDKKYECKVCGRRVAKKFMLDQHMLVHSEDKTACKFCGREFVRKYQVEAHIKAVHQKLKPFQCPHCSESFASRKTLRHHIYIHTGEKPYVCDVCGQAYRQPTCLKNHRKIHNKVGNTPNSINNGDQAAAVAAAAMAVNRTFLSSLMQSSEDAIVPSAELGLH